MLAMLVVRGCNHSYQAFRLPSGEGLERHLVAAIRRAAIEHGEVV